MSSEVHVRLKSGRYEFVAIVNRKRKRVGALRQSDLSVAVPFDADLDAEAVATIERITERLAPFPQSEANALVVDVLTKLGALQDMLGVNGPGEAAVLFDALEGTLLTTYRKIKRMNSLIVRAEGL